MTIKLTVVRHQFLQLDVDVDVLSTLGPLDVAEQDALPRLNKPISRCDYPDGNSHSVSSYC